MSYPYARSKVLLKKTQNLTNWNKTVTQFAHYQSQLGSKFSGNITTVIDPGSVD